jgi:hypothetical protein
MELEDPQSCSEDDDLPSAKGHGPDTELQGKPKYMDTPHKLSGQHAMDEDDELETLLAEREEDEERRAQVNELKFMLELCLSVDCNTVACMSSAYWQVH